MGAVKGVLSGFVSVPGGLDAITLGDGSALKPLVMLTRFGLGGPQLGGKSGGGRQHFSWVHLDDVFRAMRFLETSDLDGAVNITSPHPSTNREVMATLRRVLNVPFGIDAAKDVLTVQEYNRVRNHLEDKYTRVRVPSAKFAETILK